MPTLNSKQRKQAQPVSRSYSNTKGDKISVLKNGTKIVNGVEQGTVATPPGTRMVMRKSGSSGLVDTGSKANANYDEQGYYTKAPYESPFKDTIQTTTSYRNQTQQNLTKFDQDLARINSEALKLKGTIDEKVAQEKEDKLNSAKAGITETDPYEGLDDKNRTLTVEAEARIKKIEDNYDRISRFTDTAHKDLIAATKAKYRARVEAQRDSNKRLLATKNVSNIRQGNARYSPELAAGALTDEELQGEDRLTEIETDLILALAEAESARGKEKMDLFNAAYDRADKAYTDLNTQIQENYKMAVEKDKLIRQQEKDARDAEKQNFDMMTKRAEASAPGLIEQMKTFNSPEERMKFLQAYADKTGTDLDIIIGEVATATDDKTYKELQIDNIENQILNRNKAQSLAQTKENRLSKEEKDKEDEVSNITNNVLSGLTKYSDIEDPKVLEDAKYELSQYGLFEPEPPQWFIDEYETQATGTEDTVAGPKEIQSAWTEYRKARGII